MSVPHRFRRLSLDLKLIASYLVILGVGGLAISIVGSWIVSVTIRREAQRTVAHDVAIARLALEQRLEALHRDGGAPAGGSALADVLLAGDEATLREELTRIWQRLYDPRSQRDGGQGGERGDVTLALFAGDRLLAVAGGAGAVAPGASQRSELAARVLGRGLPWQGRLRAGGEWQLGAGEPIRDTSGAVVGMLYAGLREDTYAATRNRVISSFFAIATLGFALVIALTYRIIHVLTRPIREMVEATRRVAAGRFDHPVAVASDGEIGLLAESINGMQASLAQMRNALEESARTLEEKVRARTAELARMQARMAQSERLASIGVLAAGVAHEINNPLGGILALTSLALEELPADDSRRENLEEVVRQTRRCGDIVRQLLEFSRQGRVSAAPVDVNELLARTLALLERQSIFHNVRVERDLQPDLPRIVADAPQLQQVFVNILINAVQAMAERGTLTLTSLHDEARDQVVLGFGDSGCGIPAEQLDHVFDPFFTTKQSGQGTGLGLSIAYGIVSGHQGTIGVESEPGVGTTFTIRLPAGARVASGAPRQEGVEPAGAEPELVGPEEGAWR